MPNVRKSAKRRPRVLPQSANDLTGEVISLSVNFYEEYSMSAESSKTTKTSDVYHGCISNENRKQVKQCRKINRWHNYKLRSKNKEASRNMDYCTNFNEYEASHCVSSNNAALGEFPMSSSTCEKSNRKQSLFHCLSNILPNVRMKRIFNNKYVVNEKSDEFVDADRSPIHWKERLFLLEKQSFPDYDYAISRNVSFKSMHTNNASSYPRFYPLMKRPVAPLFVVEEYFESV